jgi:hypothetical protein
MHAGFVITPPFTRQPRNLFPSAHGGVTAARNLNESTPVGTVR